MAVWLLMLGLSFAPSLALAAAACAPICCPLEEAREDCGAGFANRACCESTATALTPSTVTTPIETPGLASAAQRVPDLSADHRPDARARFAAADLSLRASPLRLSVVLLI